MKEKLISRLIVGALAGVAAVGAFAGQIQSSSVSIAREVITDDAQAVNAPEASYRFAGDINAAGQTQTFQVQLKLQGGAKWASVAAAAAGLQDAFQIRDGIDNTLWAQNATPGATTYQILTANTNAAKDILYVTFQVDQFATKTLLKQPLITFNAANATVKTTVNTLKTIVGTVDECDVSVKNLKVEFAHFNGLSSPTALADGVTNGTADEHVRGGATNVGTLITFPTNVLVEVKAATGNAKINVPAGATSFTGTTGTSWTGSTTLANLGSVNLKTNATGYDSNLTNVYALAGTVATNADNGIDNVATATKQDGNIEATSANVAVTASQGFVVGGSLFLNDNANCAGTTLGSAVTITSGNAAGPINLAIPNTVAQLGFGAAGTAPVYVCYNVAGVTAAIPASSFSATAVLTKASGAITFKEQNNSCKGNLYALGGAIKIDVRNYSNSKDPGGWMSVIRLINNSEVRTIDVFGQIIQVDGKYGPWGKIATLAPRAVQNLTAAQVDALLVNAPASSANGDSAPQANATGARLRITSENGATLRVQNYLYNPASKNFIEASSTQGVDFEGNAERAPASEGQYQDQDAQAGLNGK